MPGWTIRTPGLDELIESLKNDGPAAVEAMKTVAVATFAEAVRRKAVEYLISGRGEWAPLHPFTVEQKGSSHPLIESGQMKDALAVWHEKGIAFVGIPPGTVRSDGSSMEDVADAMENGRVVAVTPAIRADLASKGLVLRQDTRILIIPARPFLGPAGDLVEAEESEELMKPVGDGFEAWWEGRDA